MWSKFFSKYNKKQKSYSFTEPRKKKKTLFDYVSEQKLLHRSWNADLHLPVTEETTTLIENNLSLDSKLKVEIFVSDIDGNRWYRVPFEYTPYWNSFVDTKFDI